jgi:ATP-dependent exoDNAse (exonuclease V) alpha subunit
MSAPLSRSKRTVDSAIDSATLLKLIFQVGEIQHLKEPGFFAFTKGMPVMLLQNTSVGLVNGMTGFADEVIYHN